MFKPTWLVCLVLSFGSLRSYAGVDYLLPVEYTIDKVSVVGNKYTDENLIVSLADIALGEAMLIPGPKISNAIRNIWDHGIVDNVSVSMLDLGQGHAELVIEIIELPRLSEASFLGVEKNDEEKLREKLRTKLKLVQGHPLSRSYIEDIKSLVRKHFSDEGYYCAEVMIEKTQDDASNAASLTIRVDKGEEKNIGEVYIRGNTLLDADEIKCRMQSVRKCASFTLVKNILKNIPKFCQEMLLKPFNFDDWVKLYRNNVVLMSSVFDKKKLQEDKKSILNYCRSQGFRDAQVLGTRIIKRNNSPYIDVGINMYEGKRYSLGQITWRGNDIYSEKLLARLLRFKRGDVYDSVLLKDRLSNIMIDDSVSALYYNNGYMNYTAIPVEVGVNGDTVDVEIIVNEGEQYTINKILLKGNKYTSDNIILREVKTLPGTKFSGALLKRSYRELIMLNLFDPMIDIQPLPRVKGNLVDMSFGVKENPKFEFKLSGSYVKGDGVVGGVTLYTNNASIRNIFRKRLPIGDAQELALDFSYSKKGTYSTSIKVSDPCTSEKNPFRVSWGASLASRAAYEDKDTGGAIVENEDTVGKPSVVDAKTGKNKKDATTKTLKKDEDEDRVYLGRTFNVGTNFGIARKLPWLDYSQVHVGGSYSYRKYAGQFSLLKKKETVQGHLHDIVAQVTFTRDSTDSPIFPTEGSSISVELSATPPYSFISGTSAYGPKTEITDIKFKEYHQTMIDLSLYSSLFGKLVLNAKANFGLLGSYKGLAGPFERFSMGGTMPNPGGILGKEYITLRGYEDEAILPKDDLLNYKGGVLYDKLTLELRYPVIESSYIYIYILGFAEGGNSWASYTKFNPSQIKKSLGLGIRAYIGIMLNTTIGLEFGYPLDDLDKPVKKGDREMKAQISMGMGLNIR